MSEAALDASAVLALLNGESGAEQVMRAVAVGAAIGTVNLGEAVSKLAEWGMSEHDIRHAVDGLGLEVIPFNEAQAYRAGMLRPATRAVGLSLGDRACIALAQALGLPALTADRQWAALDLAIDVRLIR